MKVRVDWEYNAVEWWEWLHEHEPEIAERFDKSGETDEVPLTAEEYSRLECGPGFHGGPKHAPRPIIVTDGQQE